MENANQKIEAKYQKEAVLFQDLLHCLDMERENLMNLNLENLWSLMETKQTILDSIEGVQGEIKGILAENHEALPAVLDDKRRITSLSDRVTHLKEQVRARVKENALFIQETLGFFDELMQIFMPNSATGSGYSSGSKKTGQAGPLILSREV